MRRAAMPQATTLAGCSTRTSAWAGGLLLVGPHQTGSPVQTRLFPREHQQRCDQDNRDLHEPACGATSRQVDIA
jgi:hypothetical protein